MTLGIQLALLLHYSFAADRLERAAQAVAAQALPRGTAAGNPPAQLAERLAGLGGGGAGFTASAAAAFAAVRDTPGADLGTLALDPDGTFRIGVLAGSTADIAALQQRLAAAGFVVDAGAIRQAGGRQLADLTVRAR